jgi:hypothetical protein
VCDLDHIQHVAGVNDIGARRADTRRMQSRPRKEDAMTRSTRYTAALAIAAAAIAPVAHADGSPAPDPGYVNVPGIVMTAPPAPFPLPDPAFPVVIPGMDARTPAAEHARVQVKAQHTAVTLITDNSPSQNKLTRRNIAAKKRARAETKTLASTLWTRHG